MKINGNLSTLHPAYSKPVLRLLVAAIFTSLVPYVNAAEVTKNVVLTGGVDYESNPALAENNKSPVWIYTFTPQFLLNVNDDVNRWFVDASLRVQRYSNEKVLVNREDPNLAVGWDRTYESGMFGVKAEYQENSSRLADLQNTGVFSNIDNTQKTRVLSAKWLHDINPKWAVLTEGAYTDVSYSVPGTLDSYKLGAISSKLSYANSEKYTTFAQLSISQISPERTYDNTDLTKLVVGSNYLISEGLNVSSQIGMYNLSGRQSDTGWVAAIKADKTTETMLYSLGVSRDLVASGVGGFRLDNSLKAGWQFNVSEHDKIGAEYQLDIYEKDISVSSDRLKYQQFIASYNRIIANHWTGRLTATYKKIDILDIHPTDTVIGATLIYDTLSF